jgi:ribonuclease P protein component
VEGSTSARIIAPGSHRSPRHLSCLGDLFPVRGPVYSPPARHRKICRRPHWETGERFEADLPAKQSQAEQDARVPDPHEDPKRTAHPCPSPEQGPGKALGLNARPSSRGSATSLDSTAPMVRPATLRRPNEFSRVMVAGKRARGRYLLVYVLYSVSGPRVGFVCGRAIGGAVVRNRARRVLREAWGEALPHLDRPFEVVVVARPEIVGASSKEVARDLAATLRTAGALLE